MQLALENHRVQVKYAKCRKSLDSAVHNMLVHLDNILSRAYGEGLRDQVLAHMSRHSFSSPHIEVAVRCVQRVEASDAAV